LKYIDRINANEVQNFGEYGDPHNLLTLACEAEDAGWDGFFLWDHLLLYRHSDIPFIDAWVALGAIAARTKRLRLGPLITPVARRRPWKLAREVVSLDHLSQGRTILGVGLGAPADAEFECFGEDPDDRCVRGSWTKHWKFWMGSGAAKTSAIVANFSTSKMLGLCRDRCRSRASQSGWRASGPTSLRCAGQRVGMACFP
jgi:hypothetical protein